MRRVLALALSAALLSAGQSALAAGAAPTDPEAPSLGTYLQQEYSFRPDAVYTHLWGADDHMAALDQKGNLWAWGSNEYGQLGFGTDRAAYNAPISVLDQVRWARACDQATLAIRTDGSLWGFGRLAPGRNTLSPVPIAQGVRAAHSADGYIAVATDSGGASVYESGPDSRAVDYVSSGAVDVALCAGIAMYQEGWDPNNIKDLAQALKGDNSARVDYILYVLDDGGTLTRYFRAGDQLHREMVAQGVTQLKASEDSVYYRTDDGVLWRCKGMEPNRLSCTQVETGVVDFAVDNLTCYVIKGDGGLYHDGVQIASGIDQAAAVETRGVYALTESGHLKPVNGNTRYTEVANSFARLNSLPSAFTSGTVAEPYYSKAWEIVGDATDDYEKARRICQWMADNLSYDNSLKNHSALQLLETGVGVCDAYSVLTELMFRAVGIPCVEVIIYGHHNWNRALIDGSVMVIDNTNRWFNWSALEEYHGPNAYTGAAGCSDWAQPILRAAANQGLTLYDSGTDLTEPITRAQFCSLGRAFLEKTTGQDMEQLLADRGVAQTPNPFTDTDDADVLALYRLGVIGGKSQDTFAPDASITRQEAALIFRALAGALGEDTSAPTAQFADGNQIASWARVGVDFVVRRGIMAGRPDGFAPNSNISHQEAIVAFYGYYSNRA